MERANEPFRAAARVERLVLKALPDRTTKQRVGDNALHLRTAKYCIAWKVHWPVLRKPRSGFLGVLGMTISPIMGLFKQKLLEQAAEKLC